MTGNEKKFKALVADFVNTSAELGGIIDSEVVATELRQRIQSIAAQIGVTEATVLRTYMPEDWGQDMARQTYRQIQERDAHVDATPVQQLPLPAVGRLIAALGQALLFAHVNNAATDPACRFNLKEAGQAVTGLGVALTAAANNDTVTVGGNILAWTKDALIVFRDNLQHQHWTSCPCGEDCGSHKNDKAVLRALLADLLLLTDTTSA
ncbi:hypothetical protein [Actinophytocola sp.]|uniref:hypothetical protein n=1 Tax=Actinophytocola sp. TaxID=1872138 RepID=UPI003899D2A8